MNGGILGCRLIEQQKTDVAKIVVDLLKAIWCSNTQMEMRLLLKPATCRDGLASADAVKPADNCLFPAERQMGDIRGLSLQELRTVVRKTQRRQQGPGGSYSLIVKKCLEASSLCRNDEHATPRHSSGVLVRFPPCTCTSVQIL
jgi:hypothetical protein